MTVRQNGGATYIAKLGYNRVHDDASNVDNYVCRAHGRVVLEGARDIWLQYHARVVGKCND